MVNVTHEPTKPADVDFRQDAQMSNPVNVFPGSRFLTRQKKTKFPALLLLLPFYPWPQPSHISCVVRVRQLTARQGKRIGL